MNGLAAIIILLYLVVVVVESKFSLKNAFNGFRRGKQQGEDKDDGSTTEEGTRKTPPTLCMLMLARDEALNIENHLPLYGPDFFDCYVLAVDSKTTDKTIETVRKIMPESIPGYVFEFEYEGLGRARTKCLEHAWREVRWIVNCGLWGVGGVAEGPTKGALGPVLSIHDNWGRGAFYRGGYFILVLILTFFFSPNLLCTVSVGEPRHVH